MTYFPPGSGTALPTSVTATGGANARLLSTRFADNVNVLDYILAVDADATNGFNRAFAYAQSLNRPVMVSVPSRTYVISSTITVTTTGNQGIYLKGDGSSCTIIKQTTDSAGFVATVNNYGAFFLGGSFTVTGITMQMAAPASTSHSAISITTSGVSGNTGVPFLLDDIICSSTSSTSYWGTGLKISGISNAGNISRISILFNGIAGGIGIDLSGTANTYSASVFFEDILVISGYIGLNLGNRLQGIHIQNYNTVNTRISLNATPNAGSNLEIMISNSYLDGKVILQPVSPAVFVYVKITDCYFDVNGMQPGDNMLTLSNMQIVHLIGNTFEGSQGNVANLTALHMDTGGLVNVVSNNTFIHIGNGGTCLVVAASSAQTVFSNNYFWDSSNYISCANSSNVFVNTYINGTFYAYGYPGNQIARCVTLADVISALATLRITA